MRTFLVLVLVLVGDEIFDPSTIQNVKLLSLCHQMDGGRFWTLSQTNSSINRRINHSRKEPVSSRCCVQQLLCGHKCQRCSLLLNLKSILKWWPVCFSFFDDAVIFSCHITVVVFFKCGIRFKIFKGSCLDTEAISVCTTQFSCV